MKIGIFGGSFDPIHIGHAILAANISGRGYADEVWLMVSPQNPLKDHAAVASDADRLEMTRIAAALCDRLRACDIELRLKPPYYSYRSLCELKKEYPQHDFSLIIGSDNWKIFSCWRDYEKILSEFGVIIYQRPGCEISDKELPQNVTLLKDAPMVELSSTVIREYFAKGIPVDFLLPHGVAKYIATHGLYCRNISKP